MSLRVEHRLRVIATCPVDESTDVYEATITLFRQVDVETILETVKALEGQTLYQEQVTEHLADVLNAQVVTVGTHSGVVTTVTAGP